MAHEDATWLWIALGGTAGPTLILLGAWLWDHKQHPEKKHERDRPRR